MTSEQQQNRNTRALAILRIGVGALFLIFGEYKVFGTQFTLGGGFQFWINKFLEGGVYPFMAPVLSGFVLPHATAIAFAVAYGEFCIGLGLVLGIKVRTRRSGNTSELRSIIRSLRCASLRSLSDAPTKCGLCGPGEHPRRSPHTSAFNGSAICFSEVEL